MTIREFCENLLWLLVVIVVVCAIFNGGYK